MIKNKTDLVKNMLKFLSVAAIYILSTQLETLLRLQPSGFVIKLQAGVALSAAMLYGWPGIAGVLLGAFTSFLIPFKLENIPWAGLTAFSSGLEAGLIAYFLRRLIRTIPPEAVVDILKSLTLILIGAVITPVITIPAIYAGGLADWANLPNNLFTSWLGSTAGMLAAAPILVSGYILVIRRENIKEWFLWPLTSILISLSLFSFVTILNFGELQVKTKIDTKFDELVGVLDESIRFHDTQSILAIRALYAASQSVERQEFKAFTESFLNEYPNIIGLTWAPQVKDADLAAFEETVRANEIPDYALYELDSAGKRKSVSQRDEYFPILFIEPLEMNQTLLGFDNASNPERMQVIGQARDSGETAFSGPLNLLQENQARLGILMVMPIYQNGMPIVTQEQRQDALLGVIIGAFDVNSLVANALKEISSADMSLVIYDVSQADHPQLLTAFTNASKTAGDNFSNTPDPDLLLSNTNNRISTIEFGTREWEIIGIPGFSYRKNSNTLSALIALMGGLMLTMAFLAYTQKRQKTDSILARSSAEFRALSEFALTGVIRFKQTGEILYANKALAQMFGYASVEEFCAQNIFTHINQPQDFEHLIKSLTAEAQLINQEVQTHNLSGESLHLLFSAALYEDVVSSTVVDITDRIKAAAELRQLSHVIMQTADEIMITDVSGRIVYVNPAFERTTGYTLAEVKGKNPRFLKSGNHGRDFYENLWDTILRGEVFEAEIINRKKNGETYTEIKTISPIRNEQGEITHFAATGKDITDRERAEAALKAEQNRNNALLANAADGIVVLGPQKKFTYASPTARKMFGFGDDDITKLDPIELTHPDDLALVLETIKAVYKDSSAVITIQYRSKNKAGHWHWIECTYRNLMDEPAIGGIVINFRDISERKTAEDKLRASEHQNRTLLEAIPDMLFRLSREGIIIDYKAPPSMQYYVPVEQFLGHCVAELMPEDVSAKTMSAMEQAFESNAPTSFEYQLLENGSYQTYEARAVANQDEQEVVFIIRNVTEEREMQNAIRASEEKYRQLSEALEEKVKERTAEVQDLYNNAPTGYHSLDINGTYVMINQTELNWLGYTRDEVVGKLKTTDLMTPDSVRDFKGIYPIFIERGWVKDFEFNYVRKDGTIFSVLINSTAIYDQDGNYLMSRTTVFDNSERKKIQDALQKSRDDLSMANAALAKASKLKDEFMASMSHELRTPLTGILGLSEALQMETYGVLNEKQTRALRNIENSGRHLLELINDILDLSKIEADKLTLQLEECSVSDICQASIQLTKGMANQKRQFVKYTTNIPTATLRADPRRFKQMLVNLLSNSIKFTPENGQVGLDVIGSEEEGVIHLTVWDKGAGIKKEDLGKLFKPFTQLDSSLSRQHSGTGLGLSLVSRLAELHGGSIRVESEYGEGSRFTITLPWILSPANQGTQDAPDLSKRIKRCLIIEDIEIHLGQISDYLQRLGLEYIPFRQGRGAVEMAVGYKPDVILLDIGLPDVPGADVLANLKSDPRTREIPVIISSVEEDPKLYKELGAVGFLVKPYTMDNLRAELNRIPTGDMDLLKTEETLPDSISVLLAEDNELILDTLADFLRANSISVVTARDGRQLVDLLPVVKPDVILTDIQMPSVDGLTAIREIRALPDPILSKLPIVAITALAMPGDKEMCLRAGANDYISKPVRLDKMVKLIRGLFVKSHPERH